MKLVSKKLADTQELAEKIAGDILDSGAHPKHARVVALAGDLGAGKTAFVQGFAKALGIKKHLPSPTFLIFRNYALEVGGYQSLYHADVYRINDPDEMAVIDFDKVLADPKNIVVVEWADKIKKILPKDSIWISFSHGSKENERIIDY